jgi:hypothetical protein
VLFLEKITYMHGMKNSATGTNIIKPPMAPAAMG